MKPDLPDPKEVARAEAERILANPRQHLQGPVERALEDCSFVDGESLLAGVESFHRERMERIPSSTKYPESPPWVEHVLAVDRELQSAAGLSDREMASYRSLGDYLKFRGYANARPATVEKCRIVYLPESDRGQLHIKNVDDPITFWKPNPNPGAGASVPKGAGRR